MQHEVSSPLGTSSAGFVLRVILIKDNLIKNLLRSDGFKYLIFLDKLVKNLWSEQLRDRERAAQEADLESRLKAEQDARILLEKQLRLEFEAFVRKFTTHPPPS